MTEPWEWEEGDLEALVTQKAEEGTEIDFKRCAALDLSSGASRTKSKKELSKDVSGFVNAAGGTIVYGMIERDHVADALDAGYDPDDVTREWIEQVVNSNVAPRVLGYRVKTVHLSGTRAGRVAYVLWLPQGTTAHQANDLLYYRRHGTECLPMEDYEVRDAMHRATEPRVSVFMRHDSDQSGTREFTIATGGLQVSPEFEFCVRNEPGAAVAEYLQTHIFTPVNVEITVGPARASRTTSHFPNGGGIDYGYLESIISPGDVPLFSGEEKFINRFQLRVSDGWPHQMPLPFILWRTRANASAPNHGAIMFERDFVHRWRFWPCSIPELPDGYSVFFAP